MKHAHVEATLTRMELAAPFRLQGGTGTDDPLPELTRCGLEIEDHPAFTLFLERDPETGNLIEEWVVIPERWTP